MKLIHILSLAVQCLSLVSASNCRTSKCNKAIADAFHCNSNSYGYPGQCANAIGCREFYKTTVYRGCATKTKTVVKPARTTTRTVTKKTTRTVTLPVAFKTSTLSKSLTTTVSTETVPETVTASTETIVSTSIETATVDATTVTGTNTITTTLVATVTTTVSRTTTVLPNKRDAVVTIKHVPTNAAELLAILDSYSDEEQTIEERNMEPRYNYRYPSVPQSVKSCLNPRSYSSACSCFGAKPSTIVRPSTTKTVTKTSTRPVVTKTVTTTIRKTTTKPQVTRGVTKTATTYITLTATTTATESVTATDYETEDITETITDYESIEATATETELATSTIEEESVTTEEANPWFAGGRCGCRQTTYEGQRWAGEAAFAQRTTANLRDCALYCDDVFACNIFDYERSTQSCRLFSGFGSAENAAGFVLGRVIFESGCGPGCFGS